MSIKIPENIDFADVDFSTPQILKYPPYRYRRCTAFVTMGQYMPLMLHLQLPPIRKADSIEKSWQETYSFQSDSQISVVDIQRMLEAGMNIARLKLSSGARGDKLRILGKLDKASLSCCQKHDVSSWPVATCLTLKTCVAKTGLLENDNDFIYLKNDTELTLFYDVSLFNKCNESVVFVDYPLIGVDVKVGTEISIAGDEIILKCISVVAETAIRCVVTKGGKLNNLSNLCVRNTRRSGPLVTKKDFKMLRFALEYQIDAVIISYARHPDTIKIINKYITSKKVRRPLILSGISSEEGLENIDGIIKESDGVILSRPYLPYELESSKQYRMPQIQKWIAGKCLQAGKSLYIYGVFENALNTGNFTNNEIADVTNAIMDGASGFILGECSNPDHIVEALKGINELCYTVEPLVTSKINFKRIINEPEIPINAVEATAISCATLANQSNARLVVVPSVSGRTLGVLRRMRLCCLVIAVSTDAQVSRRLIAHRGAQHNDWYRGVEARILFALEYAVKRSWLQYGDTYVTLQRGSDTSAFCDMVRIWKVNISKKPVVECIDHNEEQNMF